MNYSRRVLRICRVTIGILTLVQLPRACFPLVVVLTAAFAVTPPSPRAVSAGVEQRALIPLPSLGISMRTAIVRPTGRGPFPLIVINHASTESAQRRANMAEPRYSALTHWFSDRGYLVALPQRPGHGLTGGPYPEDQGGCDDADYVRSGNGAAVSIQAALTDLLTRPDVRKTGAIVAGHSAGGWGGLALASRNPRGVAAIINFAGGRGGRSFDHANNNCAPERLIDAARVFGSTARVPTLWIYAENDSYFAPWLVRRMAEAWRFGGGQVELALLPAFGLEGHRLAEADDGAGVWGPVVAGFLAKVK